MGGAAICPVSMAWTRFLCKLRCPGPAAPSGISGSFRRRSKRAGDAAQASASLARQRDLPPARSAPSPHRCGASPGRPDARARIDQSGSASGAVSARTAAGRDSVFVAWRISRRVRRHRFRFFNSTRTGNEIEHVPFRRRIGHDAALVVVSNGPVPAPLPFATMLDDETMPAPPGLDGQRPVPPGARPGAIETLAVQSAKKSGQMGWAPGPFFRAMSRAENPQSIEADWRQSPPAAPPTSNGTFRAG